jgi:hypothetical protein
VYSGAALRHHLRGRAAAEPVEVWMARCDYGVPPVNGLALKVVAAARIRACSVRQKLPGLE